jgi:hypothetical protein
LVEAAQVVALELAQREQAGAILFFQPLPLLAAVAVQSLALALEFLVVLVVVAPKMEQAALEQLDKVMLAVQVVMLVWLVAAVLVLLVVMATLDRAATAEMAVLA